MGEVGGLGRGIFVFKTTFLLFKFIFKSLSHFLFTQIGLQISSSLLGFNLVGRSLHHGVLIVCIESSGYLFLAVSAIAAARTSLPGNR